MGVVGESVVRVDAASKADGTLRYTDDLPFEGLYGAVVRSEIAYGKIRAITFDASFDFSDIIIVDHRDIEGRNANVVLTDDQPFLAEARIRHIGEPILLMAHRSKHRLREAMAHITIDYDAQEPVLSMEESLALKQRLYGEDNVFKAIHTVQGSPPQKTGLFSLEKTYTTQHQEQAYLEPQSMLARYNGGRVKIIGSMQCPFFVEAALEGLAGEKIEVEQAPTGGGFGGKEDYPSLIAGYAYLLCKKAGQDVKIVYEREEDIAYTTKRHPSKLRYRSRFDATGKLHALEVDVTIDGGAYVTLSPVVLARCVLHAAGFYDCGYIRVDARAVATNTPPNGAFRGFGAPQVLFGIERHMDDIARHLGLSPAAVREGNLPGAGSVGVSGVPIAEYARLRDLFETARRESGFDAIYDAPAPNRGIGMALFMHGAGYTGVGESMLASSVSIALEADGSVEIRVGSVEMGQGTLTALPQIVADALDLPVGMVSCRTPNTAEVADSGPTVASRTVMIVGRLLAQAAGKLKTALGDYGTPDAYRAAVARYCKSGGPLQFGASYEQPAGILWDEDLFYGNGYEAYGLGCYIAEVEVDPVDYRVRVVRFDAYNDVGQVVNPVMAEGQVEGGVAQGIGYALFERLVYEAGRVHSPHLSDYTLPMAPDLPEIAVRFLGTDGPSLGLGELPMDGPSAAVANALVHALGSAFDALPIIPEAVEEACR
ncbi:xanthine dehydrogenase family protein molybdopterin-binding subunit [Sulfurimonas sp. HSL1-6]|uniref:xanthine dehydrogenase family protein molybdopterin-binding subunit n=1 Tax=Thiomicrolovo immobilis TaxID=3131935 RepID=UPI0031F8AAD2